MSWDTNNNDRVVNCHVTYLKGDVLLFTDGTTKFNNSLHSADSTLDLGIKVFFTYSREVKEVDGTIIRDIVVLWNELLEGLVDVLSQVGGERSLGHNLDEHNHVIFFLPIIHLHIPWSNTRSTKLQREYSWLE